MKNLITFFLLILLLSGCTSVPYTNRSQLMLTSETTECKLGEDAFNEVKKQSTISGNSIMNSAVNRVGTNISKAAGKSEYNWEFVVVQSKEANAFCLPGGKVVVYTELFKFIKMMASLLQY